MSDAPAKLILLCGKAAAGKSTLAAKIAAQENAVLIVEDNWLSTLFGARMATLADYQTCAATLRRVMAPHVTSLLRTGVTVVLDFPANTPKMRAWMQDAAQAGGAAAVIHVFDVSDRLCKERLKARNAAGTHPFRVSDAQFDQLAKHYQPPQPEEGFDVIVHQATHGQDGPIYD